MEEILVIVEENNEIINVEVIENSSNSDSNSHTHPNKAILDLITEAFTTALLNNIITTNAHIASSSNPHNTTKAQVGLANVDNTSDANKPVSTAMVNAIAAALVTAENYADGLFDTLVGSSPTDMDTIQEITAALQNNPNIIAEIIASLGKRIRFDVNNQGLSSTEKLYALTNLGINNINNTADADKPISNDTAAAFALKVDKITGKELSTNDFSNEYKNRLLKTFCTLYKSAQDSIVVNGPISEQILLAIPVTAGDIAVDDIIDTIFNFKITGINGQKAIKILWNNNAALLGAAPIGIYNITSSRRAETIKRRLAIKSISNVEVVNAGISILNDELGSTSQMSNLNIDMTIGGYILVTTINASPLDSITISSYRICK